MIYRPQFAYPTPDGFTDYDFDHYFDFNSVPSLNPVGAPREVANIPLPLDSDAVFCWRGIKIPNLAVSATNQVPFDIALRFREPNQGRYLQSAYLPIWMYGIVGFDGTALTGGITVAFESEVICPPASIVMLDQLAAVMAGGSLGPTYVYLQEIMLCGVKRYPKQ